jgi:hypothetical protein
MEPRWPPPELTPAVALVSFETTVEVIVVAARADYRPALRVALVLCIALKYAFAWFLGRRSAAALLGLVLWEVTAVLAAVASSGWHAGLRVGLAVIALATVVLLVRLVRAFPEATVPSLRSE